MELRKDESPGFLACPQTSAGLFSKKACCSHLASVAWCLLFAVRDKDLGSWHLWLTILFAVYVSNELPES